MSLTEVMLGSMALNWSKVKDQTYVTQNLSGQTHLIHSFFRCNVQKARRTEAIYRAELVGLLLQFHAILI